MAILAITAAAMTMPMPMKMTMTAPAAARAEWAAFGQPGGTPDRTVAITAIDMKFQPDVLRVRPGEAVRFVVTDRGKLAHEFVIGDRAFQAQHQKEMLRMPNMKMDEPNELSLQPGQTKTLTWRFTHPGAFLFDCDLPGHAQAGMVGRIYVR